MPLVEIKDFNPLVDNRSFFHQPAKIKQEEYEKLIEILKNNYYTKENLEDFLYHQKYYKLVNIDLLRQKNTSIR